MKCLTCKHFIDDGGYIGYGEEWSSGEIGCDKIPLRRQIPPMKDDAPSIRSVLLYMRETSEYCQCYEAKPTTPTKEEA